MDNYVSYPVDVTGIQVVLTNARMTVQRDEVGISHLQFIGEPVVKSGELPECYTIHRTVGVSRDSGLIGLFFKWLKLEDAAWKLDNPDAPARTVEALIASTEIPLVFTHDATGVRGMAIKCDTDVASLFVNLDGRAIGDMAAGKDQRTMTLDAFLEGDDLDALAVKAARNSKTTPAGRRPGVGVNLDAVAVSPKYGI